MPTFGTREVHVTTCLISTDERVKSCNSVLFYHVAVLYNLLFNKKSQLIKCDSNLPLQFAWFVPYLVQVEPFLFSVYSFSHLFVWNKKMSLYVLTYALLLLSTLKSEYLDFKSCIDIHKKKVRTTYLHITQLSSPWTSRMRTFHV